MGHNITAIILKGKYNLKIAEQFDLHGISLEYDLTMFYIDHYFSAYWQAKLGIKGLLDINSVDAIIIPCECVLAELMTKISKSKEPQYAIIATDYFGGIGTQYANVYIKNIIADRSIKTINQALSFLGVKKTKGMDEFDTLGLGNYRSNPDYLDKYVELADELGV